MDETTTQTRKRARRGSKVLFRRKRKDGTEYPGWYVRWLDAAGDRHQAFGGRTHTAAQAFLRAKLDERDRHRQSGERPVRLQSLHDFLPDLTEHWKATTQRATWQGRTGFLKRSAEHFGRKPMSQITQADVAAWFTQFRNEHGTKASTMRTWSAALASAFTAAIALGRCRTNPVRGVKLAKPDEKPIPRLTVDELHRLYAGMPSRLRPYVVLLGELGLRRGEALDLTWTAFDAGFGRVTVRRSKNHRPRVVPLTARARAEVERLWKTRGSHPIEGPDYVFDFNSSFVNAQFREAADRAGFPFVTPHTLRHAVGVSLAEAGVPTRDIRDVLGHHSIQVTERYMGRAPQSALERAMQRLDVARTAVEPKAQAEGA